RASITGRIPAIEHEGFWLAESSAIVEYLEDLFPAPRHQRLLPADLKDRARARMIMAWIRSSRDLLPLIKERSTATMFYEKAKEPLAPEASESAQKLVEVAELLIPQGRTQLFEEWSIADSDLAFCLCRLTMNGHATNAKIEKFVDAQWTRPSVKEFVER